MAGWLASLLFCFSGLAFATSSYVIGHKNPDTDAVMAAIAAAEFYDYIPAVAGPVNQESLFVLRRLALETPSVVTQAGLDKFFLVDFNQRSQGIEGLSGENILGIVDHHALQEDCFKFSEPISITIKPVGSTCTLIYSEYKVEGRPISKKIAGAMLAGILSDTLLLRSPTTTELDKKAVDELSLQSALDAEKFAAEMFKAKSDLSKYSISEIIQLDFKEYYFKGLHYAIGVAETIDPDSLINQAAELRQAMALIKQQKDLNYLFFIVVDINSLTSKMIVLGEDEQIAAYAIGLKLESTSYSDIFSCGNLISRKRDFVPLLEGYFSKF